MSGTRGEPAAPPRHVLHVLNGASGGAAMSTLALIDGLRGYGVESSAICHPAGTEDEFEALRQATSGRLLRTPLYWWNRKIRTALWKRPLFEAWQGLATGWARASARRIARFAAEHSVELLHTNTLLTPDGGLASRLLGLAHVWHTRELIGPQHPFRLRRRGATLGRYLARHCERVVANSPSAASCLGAGLPEGWLVVVPNAVEPDRFVAAEQSPRDRPIVAMVANLTSRVKNHPLFLETCARVRHPTVGFRIYGHDPCHGGGSLDSSYCRELHAQIDRLGLRGRIEFPGYVARPERIMSEIDLLVHPSGHESFGRVAIEAMAASRPVVGIAAGGIGDIVRHGETGLLVDREDAAALAAAVDRLLADPALRGALGSAGRRRVEAHYSIGRHLERMVEVYTAAAEQHRADAETAILGGRP